MTTQDYNKFYQGKTILVAGEPRAARIFGVPVNAGSGLACPDLRLACHVRVAINLVDPF